MKFFTSYKYFLFALFATQVFSACSIKISALTNLSLTTSSGAVTTPPEDCELELNAFLGQGFFNTGTGKISTGINALGELPLSSPYSASPYFQDGTETVGAGFFTTYPEISDWVLVELRSSTSPTSVVSRKSAFLDENGKLRDLDGNFTVTFNVVPGDYYVVLYHRSHLAVISSTKLAMSSSAVASYDFTDAASKSLQGSAGSDLLVELVAGKWCMHNGDLNYDNAIEYHTDMSELWAIHQAGTAYAGVNTAQFFAYSFGDTNGDGKVRYTGAGNDRDVILVSAGGSGGVWTSGSSFVSYPLAPVGGASLFSSFAGSSAISLKVFLTGPYSSGTGKMSTILSSSSLIPTASPYGADWSTSGATSTPSVSGAFLASHPEFVDWVQIELRLVRSGSPLARVSAFLDEDGNLISTSGSSDVPLPVKDGSYYVVVRHRNHLLTSTASMLPTAASPVLYDLTDSKSKTYMYVRNSGTFQNGGTKDINGGLVFGLPNGDLNQDGYINCGAAGKDDDYLLNTVLGGDSNAVVTTYQPGDINWDGSISYSIGSNDYGALFTSLSSNCANYFRKLF